jgi:hypothetical protein
MSARLALVVAALCTVVLLVSHVAHAEGIRAERAEGVSPAALHEGAVAEYPYRVAVEVGLEDIQFGGGKDGFAGSFNGLSAGLLFGVAPRWSFGLTGALLLQGGESSFGDPYVTVFGRVDAEARFHPLLGSWGELWLGGLAGMPWFDQPDKFGVHLGAGTGFDVHPLAAISLGVHARTGLYWAPGESSGRAGPLSEASASFVLGFRAP